MKSSSLRRNLLGLLGLYGVSLVAASGCPNQSQAPVKVPMAIKAPATDKESAPKEAASKNSASRNTASKDAEIKDAASEAKGQNGLAQSAAEALHQAKHQPFDPIAVNGQFFEGWKKPKLALVITGRQDGYLEPCGCAGIENQKGGLARRHTFIKQLKADGWPVAAVDVGGFIRRFGSQAEIQLGVSAVALEKMGYCAAGLGPQDLRLPDTALLAMAVEHDLFVAANYSILDQTPRFRIVEAGGLKLGITAVLGEEFQKQAAGGGIEFTPPAKALAEVMDQLKECDVRILLAYAGSHESLDLATKFPDFDFVVMAGGGDEPPGQPTEVADTKTRLIEVGHKGMFAIVVGLFDDKDQPVRYQRVALDSRYKNSSDMVQVMTDYQDNLQALGWKGLGLRSVPHPRAEKGDELSGKFAGTDSCKRCHESAWDVWSESRHAHATQTLVDLKPARQYDAECISCHATGWNPQEYFPYASGFESLEATPHLAGNSCENCHGPSAAHVAAEAGDDVGLRDRVRELIGKAAKEENTCTKCHDGDNSPRFDFDKYWPVIEH